MLFSFEFYLHGIILFDLLFYLCKKRNQQLFHLLWTEEIINGRSQENIGGRGLDVFQLKKINEN